MRLESSQTNPLPEFLNSLLKHDEDAVLLTSNNLPVIALYLNSGGVICETHDEVVKVLHILAESTNLIEIIDDNKLRITEHGKVALEASKRPLRSLQNLQKDGSKS